MGRTVDMFAHLKPPRVKRMRVCDVGAGENTGHIAMFKCTRCGEESEWIEFNTIKEIRRGIPCPVCNNENNDD